MATDDHVRPRPPGPRRPVVVGRPPRAADGGRPIVTALRMTLTGLRVAAISVLERVELVAARWPTGTVTADEVEALVSAVHGLHEDLDEHFDVAESAGADGLAVMLEIREGIIATAVIVAGVLATATPEAGAAACRRGGAGRRRP